MRKFFIACSMLALAGCASISNPVSTTEVYNLEASYGVLSSAAKAYLLLPACPTGTNFSIQNICHLRSASGPIASADVKARAALTLAEKFVRDNPTISAASAISAAQAAVAAFQTISIQYIPQ